MSQPAVYSANVVENKPQAYLVRYGRSPWNPPPPPPPKPRVIRVVRYRKVTRKTLVPVEGKPTKEDILEAIAKALGSVIPREENIGGKRHRGWREPEADIQVSERRYTTVYVDPKTLESIAKAWEKATGEKLSKADALRLIQQVASKTFPHRRINIVDYSPQVARRLPVPDFQSRYYIWKTEIAPEIEERARYQQRYMQEWKAYRQELQTIWIERNRLPRPDIASPHYYLREQAYYLSKQKPQTIALPVSFPRKLPVPDVSSPYWTQFRYVPWYIKYLEEHPGRATPEGTFRYLAGIRGYTRTLNYFRKLGYDVKFMGAPRATKTGTYLYLKGIWGPEKAWWTAYNTPPPWTLFNPGVKVSEKPLPGTTADINKEIMFQQKIAELSRSERPSDWALAALLSAYKKGYPVVGAGAGLAAIMVKGYQKTNETLSYPIVAYEKWSSENLDKWVEEAQRKRNPSKLIALGIAKTGGYVLASIPTGVAYALLGPVGAAMAMGGIAEFVANPSPVIRYFQEDVTRLGVVVGSAIGFTVGRVAIGKSLAWATKKGYITPKEFRATWNMWTLDARTVSYLKSRIDIAVGKITGKYIPAEKTGIYYNPSFTDPISPEELIRRFAWTRQTTIHTSDSPFWNRWIGGFSRLKARFWGRLKGENIDVVRLEGFYETANPFRKKYEILHFYKSLPTDEGVPQAYLAYMGVKGYGYEGFQFKLFRSSGKLLIFRNELIRYYPPLPGEDILSYNVRIGTTKIGETMIPPENVFGVSIERQVITPAHFIGRRTGIEYPGSYIQRVKYLGYTYYKNPYPGALGRIPVIGDILADWHKIHLIEAKTLPGTGVQVTISSKPTTVSLKKIMSSSYVKSTATFTLSEALGGGLASSLSSTYSRISSQPRSIASSLVRELSEMKRLFSISTPKPEYRVSSKVSSYSIKSLMSSIKSMIPSRTLSMVGFKPEYRPGHLSRSMGKISVRMGFKMPRPSLKIKWPKTKPSGNIKYGESTGFEIALSSTTYIIRERLKSIVSSTESSEPSPIKLPQTITLVPPRYHRGRRKTRGKKARRRTRRGYAEAVFPEVKPPLL